MSKMHYFSNKFSKIADVITITLSKNVTKLTSQKFFQFGPLSIKISGCASGLGLIILMVFKKSCLGLEKVVLVLKKYVVLVLVL